MTNRTLHLNLFPFGCGHHQAAWRQQNSSVERLGDIRFYEELAQLAERGKMDAVFLADGSSIDRIAEGPRWFFEPLTCLAAMARATSHIGLISTVSSTFFTPFHAARMLASLDHISQGRIGWNVVTSMFDTEARNHGYEAMPDHATRYARAEEFIQAVLALWDSWDDDAMLNDRHGWYVDTDKIRPIHHKGQHFSVEGPLTIPRPPQGHPVLFQAGASEYGRNLAARHAEAIYVVASDLETAIKYRKDVRQRMHTAGRSAPLPVLPGLVTYVASSIDEAREKQRELDELLPTRAALKQLEGFIFQDCSQWELDAQLPALPPLETFNGPKGRYATILRIIEEDKPTLRQLLGRLAAGGGHFTLVGTPEHIADKMEQWLVEGGADGFNLMPPSLPGSVEDFVEQVIPVLQQRELFRKDYSGNTLRNHLGLPRPA